MRAGSRVGVLLVAALALSASKPAPPKVEFPGPGVAADPSGRYLIQWREASYAAPHELFLFDVHAQTSVLLWEFPRSVSVLWAPGGRRVAVTDFSGSDASDVLVFNVSDPNSPVRVSSLVERSKGHFKDQLTENHYAYIEAVTWQSDSTLRLRAWGHGEMDPGGFEVFLDYRVGGGLKEAKP